MCWEKSRIMFPLRRAAKENMGKEGTPLQTFGMFQNTKYSALHTNLDVLSAIRNETFVPQFFSEQCTLLLVLQNI